MEKVTKAEVKTKTVIIPIDEKDPDNFVTVCINGNVSQIKKGEEVEVAEEVYNILKRSGYLGMKVRQGYNMYPYITIEE